MYTLKDNGIMKEMAYDNNFEYILEDNACFAATDYKILQNQTNGIFVQCMKMMRNGKISLYYVTDEYRTVCAMLSGITPNVFMSVIINLLLGVIEVRNNGFLACQCIDLSWDKIFVEQKTMKIKLVYLPLNVKAFDNYAEFESALRSSIVNLINKMLTVTNERIEQFTRDLYNGSLTLDDIYNKSRNIGTAPILRQESELERFAKPQKESEMKLVAINAPDHFEILLSKDEMYIGKKQEMVDAVIPYNNAISRKHCKIVRKNGKLYISDEGSANGTYVNRTRVNAGQQMPIDKGDIIRLANSDFQLV